MRADYRVLLDACVLANFGVCDLFLRLSERPRLIQPCWSRHIMEEVRRAQTEKLHWPAALADSFQTEANHAFPQAMIEGYERLVPSLANQPKDRHVLAAAIRGNCPLIVTFNLRHFPAESLTPWGIAVSHPDDYLVILHEMEPQRVGRCIGEIAGRRGLEVEDSLIRLGRSLPQFASRLLDELNG